MNITLNSILKNFQKTVDSLDKYAAQQSTLLAKEDEAIEELQHRAACRLADITKAETVKQHITDNEVMDLCKKVVQRAG